MNAEDEVDDLRRLLIAAMQRLEALAHECKTLKREKTNLEQRLWQTSQPKAK